MEAAGGQILFWNGVRVMGVLAVSRAIGDHCLRPFVIAQPEVRAALGSVACMRTCIRRHNFAVQGLELIAECIIRRAIRHCS